MIRFPCGTCGRRLRVPARLAGKRGRCERCGAINRVPPVDVPPPDGEPAHEGPREVEQTGAPAAAAHAVVEPPAPPSPPPPTNGDARETPAPPPAPTNGDAREAPAPPPAPKAEGARSFSTDAVPAEESAAVEVPTPAFGIDEASVFPPVGEFEKVADVDFSHAPAAHAEPAPEGPVKAEVASEADEQPPSAAGDEPEIEPLPEPEPEVVAVDVRRAAASPFRTTADMRPRQMIEGTVELPGAQFAAATLPATIGPGSGGAASGGAASTFLELVAQRMGVIHQPARGTATQAITPKSVHGGAAVDPEDEEPVIRILHIDVDDEPRAPAREAREARVRVPERRAPAPVARAALPPASAVAAVSLAARRAVVTALVIGLIVGFVLGLVVADLL